MSYEGFTIDKADGTAVVAINTPPANTYNFELMKELDAIMRTFVSTRISTSSS